MAPRKIKTRIEDSPTRSVAVGILCVAGIYTSYSIFSIAQEKIYTLRHPQTSKPFSYGVFLVLSIATCSQFVGALGLFMERGAEATALLRARVKDSRFVLNFALIAMSYVGAMVSSNMALQHVNYPTQILVKSAKMVPVVVGGYVFFRKRYPWYDYVSVTLITSSLVFFNLYKDGSHKEVSSTLLGIALCGVSLLCDGLTGPRQDELMKSYTVSQWEHMLFTNSFAVLWSSLIMLFIEGAEPIRFCLETPSALSTIGTVALCSALGQIFIFVSLTKFGALYLSLITTTRKFFTILLSVIIYGHHLNAIQWTCVAAVFAAIGLQTFCKKSRPKSRLPRMKKA